MLFFLKLDFNTNDNMDWNSNNTAFIKIILSSQLCKGDNSFIYLGISAISHKKIEDSWGF